MPPLSFTALFLSFSELETNKAHSSYPLNLLTFIYTYFTFLFLTNLNIYMTFHKY